MGLSVDSRFSHANWAVSLGGVSFPLLSDFHPKGQVASAYDMYIEAAGISARATVMIDAAGVVRYAEPVEPGGQRDMPALTDEMIRLVADYEGDLDKGMKTDRPSAKLFIKSNCGFSRAALAARENLHLQDAIPVVNISDDPSAAAELAKLTGKNQAPCLLIDDEAMLESEDIIRTLVSRTTGLWS